MSFLKTAQCWASICIVLSLLICFALTPLFNRAYHRKRHCPVVKDIKAVIRSPGIWCRPWRWAATICRKTSSGSRAAVGKYATADLFPATISFPS